MHDPSDPKKNYHPESLDSYDPRYNQEDEEWDDLPHEDDEDD